MANNFNWGQLTWSAGNWGLQEPVTNGWGRLTWGENEWGVTDAIAVSVTGQSLTTSLNSVTADAVTNVSVTGQSLTGSLNSVTVTGSAVVSLTGNTLTIQLNSVNPQVWTIIDTGSTVTWTEVDTAA